MISTSFDYKRAATIDEAIHALNEDSKILAGGHSLIPALKLRLNQTGTSIDISRIEALKLIRFVGGHLVIGAAATHASIADSAEVRLHASLFAQVASQIGDVQVRNAGTIGGSIAHADPAADWPAALLATDAMIKVVGKGGHRMIPAAEFFTGIYSTDLGPDEIITEIQVSSMQGKSAKYTKFAQPASRFALVGCAVSAKVSAGTMSDVRVAFTGVSDTPYCDVNVQSVLEGKKITQATVDLAVSNLDTSIYIMQDHYANEDYRQHLAGVMLSRALKALI